MIVYTDRNRAAFQIDEDDYEPVSRYSWHICSYGYPATAVGKCATQKKIPLHLFLMGNAPHGLEWDHINRDKLDNRRSNLRVVTSRMNRRNSRATKGNTSGVKGVWWDSRVAKWHAAIGFESRKVFLGYFSKIEDATLARIKAEGRFWGGDGMLQIR